VAEFRDDPRIEGRAALGDLGYALIFGVLAAAVWVGVNSYWPAQWVQPDKPTRDRIVLIVSGVLVVLAGMSLAGGMTQTLRWRRARRWQCMLSDPKTAYLVPPLAMHVRSVPSPLSRFVLVRLCVLFGVTSVGLIVYGALAITGRVPAFHDKSGEDQSVNVLLCGLGFAVLTIASAQLVRKRRVARKVEQLSSDTTIARPPNLTADVAVRPSSSIPRLNVVFSEDPAGSPLQAIADGVGRSLNDPLYILYLRLFDNIVGTTRFLNGPWRRFGYVCFLRSATQVDPDELESAEESGSVASMFISTPDQLEAALAKQATRWEDKPRPKGFIKTWRWAKERGRYPVVALLCHGGFWKPAVDLLLARMDFVALDLCGYRPEHAGTRYELQRVIDRYPIDRVTLLAETASDRLFLTAQVKAAWAQMADGSPNAGTGRSTAHVIVLSLD